MNTFNTEYIQVVTTTNTRELAVKIAETVVKKKLGACGQISGPITSIYEWKNNIESSEEFYCTIKTRAELFEKVENCIKSLHPYEVPEIIATPIINGSKDYLDWINEITRGDTPIILN